ncbi:hypothetical protein CVT25_014364 [Psilocybe cyanescens]|uniref:Uncharacterized protein n=1 Tax=Psilocybe cyanescens TaxID=93625 RepID=A0A409XPG9_PSICY|nr:hypothetical protein CVT25_014364 [Psilocybe cyanescens]
MEESWDAVAPAPSLPLRVHGHPPSLIVPKTKAHRDPSAGAGVGGKEQRKLIPKISMLGILGMELRSLRRRAPLRALRVSSHNDSSCICRGLRWIGCSGRGAIGEVTNVMKVGGEKKKGSGLRRERQNVKMEEGGKEKEKAQRWTTIGWEEG